MRNGDPFRREEKQRHLCVIRRGRRLPRSDFPRQRCRDHGAVEVAAIGLPKICNIKAPRSLVDHSFRSSPSVYPFIPA